MSKLLNFVLHRWFLFALGLILGAAVILAIRFFTYMPDTVHYHANFAVFVNGQQEQFKGPRYYEETDIMSASTCSVGTAGSPNERAHMHDNINNVVHVEDHLVTWGNFFQNLRWGIGSDYLASADGVLTPDATNTLVFILNGKKVDDVSNTIIGDQDKLLISYGTNTDSQLQQEYSSIQNNAKKYDEEQDPASCSGHKTVTVKDRLAHLL